MLRSQRESSGAAMIAVGVPTSLGIFLARFSDHGLARLEFPIAPAPATPAIPEHLSNWATLTRAALESVLSGHAPAQLPPLDLRSGTQFQRAVWHALLKIPAGQTKTYAEIAIEVGSPKATRAVGSACGANPIPVLIPCHRVLASGGKIGGFSAGLDWKRRLLAIEGIGDLELELSG